MKNILPRKNFFNTTRRAHSGQRKKLGAKTIQKGLITPPLPRWHGLPLEESLLKCNLYNTAAETQCNVSNGLSNAPTARTQARTGTDEG